jgi:putative ubiquitin-RnfH superfamily antitoxin RatB of RatAB toxin-antitoxin module
VNVTVVWATPHLQDVVAVELTLGATIADAVRRSGLVAQYGLDPATLRFARYGVRAVADACLGDGDRVEITRALLVEPKVARVRRARLKAPDPGASQARPGTAK